METRETWTMRETALAVLALSHLAHSPGEEKIDIIAYTIKARDMIPTVSGLVWVNGSPAYCGQQVYMLSTAPDEHRLILAVNDAPAKDFARQVVHLENVWVSKFYPRLLHLPTTLEWRTVMSPEDFERIAYEQATKDTTNQWHRNGRGTLTK